jgi:hypothetical protein
MTIATSFINNKGVPSFVSESPDSGRLRLLLELGGSLALTDYLEIFTDYKGSFRKKDRIHSLTLGVAFSF